MIPPAQSSLKQSQLSDTAALEVIRACFPPTAGDFDPKHARKTQCYKGLPVVHIDKELGLTSRKNVRVVGAGIRHSLVPVTNNP